MTKSIQLPVGTDYVRYDELAHLIADALWPDTGPADDRWNYGGARVSLDAELKTAVRAGALELKDPLTFGPHTFPVGNALNSALLAVSDLRALVAGRGLSVEVGSTTGTSLADVKPIPKQRLQEDWIINTLTENSFDPANLPDRVPGKTGAKHAVQKLALQNKALFSDKSFSLAWERLRSDGRIVGGG